MPWGLSWGRGSLGRAGSAEGQRRAPVRYEGRRGGGPQPVLHFTTIHAQAPITPCTASDAAPVDTWPHVAPEGFLPRTYTSQAHGPETGNPHSQKSHDSGFVQISVVPPGLAPLPSGLDRPRPQTLSYPMLLPAAPGRRAQHAAPTPTPTAHSGSVSCSWVSNTNARIQGWLYSPLTTKVTPGVSHRPQGRRIRSDPAIPPSSHHKAGVREAAPPARTQHTPLRPKGDVFICTALYP